MAPPRTWNFATNHIEIYAVFHAHRFLVLSLFNTREIINLFEWNKSIPLTESETETEVAEYHPKCITCSSHAHISHIHIQTPTSR